MPITSEPQETLEQRTYQIIMGDYISMIRGTRLEHLGTMEHLDCKEWKGDILLSYSELRTRTTPKHEYRDYFLNSEKIDDAVQKIKDEGIPCFVYVLWSDELGVFDVQWFMEKRNRRKRWDHDVRTFDYISYDHCTTLLKTGASTLPEALNVLLDAVLHHIRPDLFDARADRTSAG
jgi:hypothetical protein